MDQSKEEKSYEYKNEWGLIVGLLHKKKYQTDTPTGVQSNITTKHFGKI